MIKVFFESNTHAELIAVFENEDIYLSCVPVFEKLAQERGVFLTESIEEEMILTKF